MGTKRSRRGNKTRGLGLCKRNEGRKYKRNENTFRFVWCFVYLIVSLHSDLVSAALKCCERDEEGTPH